MTASSSSWPLPRHRRWHPLGLLTTRRIGTALVGALVVALLLKPIFSVTFLALLGRTVFIAMILLIAFALAGLWRRELPPRWVVQAAAVLVAAPLATFAVYLLSSGGDVESFLHNEARVAGFLWIAGSGMLVGSMLAMAALYRERDAKARAEALAFALEKSTFERQALDARLATLRAQVEPHFLFNTLANVQALVASGSPQAGPVLASLVAYLRAAMPRPDAPADDTLGVEAERVRAYLALMRLRMPDRLAFEVRLDPALADRRFPSLGLLTLVENAVRHGVDPSEQGGSIEVIGAPDGKGGMRLAVVDTGCGLDPRAAPGTGLANLKARLDAFYAGTARLELHQNAPRGVRAEIVVSAAPAA